MKDDPCTCTVEISPDEIDAGADITLKVQATCPGKDRLRGARVSIRDHEGAELAQAELAKIDDDEDDDDTYVSDDIVLVAPRTAGEHVYRAVVVTPGKEGTPGKESAWHEQASTEVRLAVQPHTPHLNVWDLPSAIVAGGRFKFMVGVKCSAACCLTGHGLSVLDQGGAQVGAADLGRDV